MRGTCTKPWTRELRTAGILTSIATLLVALAVLLFVSSPAHATVRSSADARTIQTDGRISAILPVGNRIYISGTFLKVNGAPRARLAALDAKTGKLTSWNPGANSWVMTLAASPDGKRIYAGGTFSRVDGAVHNRLAAINAGTGRVDNSWNPQANNSVRTLDVRGSKIYLGGDFTLVNEQSRGRLAAVNALGGTLDTNWRPVANNSVYKLDVSDNGRRIYAGGLFSTISGLSRPNLASINPATGAPQAWRPNPQRPIIDFSAKGKRVYTAEGGPGGAVKAYSAVSGKRLWSLSADGDAQTLTLYGGRVYVGGHFDVLGGQRRVMFAAVNPATGRLDPWAPRANGGVWDLVPDVARRKLYAGGDFTLINGVRHGHFARFSTR